MTKSKLEKIIFIPDSHHPYADYKAYNLLHSVAKHFKPDHVIIQGDFCDFYDVSSHSKDPGRRFKLDEEIDKCKEELQKVKKWGAKNNVFVSGNHEDRLERYLRDKAPELYKVISIPKILELDKMGFKYIPYKESYKIGKLYNTHDAGSAGKTAVQKALDAFQHNITIGHIHRISYVVEGDAEGNRHVAASFGWLGDVEEIDYMNKVNAKRSWSLGFGIGYLDKATGVVYLTPVPIINYTCVVEGKLFKA